MTTPTHAEAVRVDEFDKRRTTYRVGSNGRVVCTVESISRLSPNQLDDLDREGLGTHTLVLVPVDVAEELMSAGALDRAQWTRVHDPDEPERGAAAIRRADLNEPIGYLVEVASAAT